MNEQKFDELISQTLKEQAEQTIADGSLDLWPAIARQLQTENGLPPQPESPPVNNIYKLRDWRKFTLLGMGLAAAIALLVLAIPLLNLLTRTETKNTVVLNPTNSAGTVLPPPTVTPSIPGDKLLATLSGHTGTVRSVTWSPDGSKLASAGEDKTVRVWTKDGKELTVLKTDGPNNPSSVAWSPTGQFLAVGFGNTVRVWISSEGSFEKQFALNDFTLDGPVVQLAWAPDGTKLAASSGSGKGRIWSENGNVLAELAGADAGLAWTPDGNWLATGNSNGTITLWSAAGSKLNEFGYKTGSPISSLKLSPDGRWLTALSKDGVIRLWSENGGTFSDTNPPFQYENDGKTINFSLDWSPTNMVLATASNDGKVRLYYPDALPAETYVGHTGAFITSVAFSPDGKMLASAGDDKTIRLWQVDPAKGQSWDSSVKPPPGPTPTPLTFANGRVSWVWRVGSTTLVRPTGIAVDSARRVYVVDELSTVLTKFDTNGKIINSWKMPQATLGKPKLVAVDNYQGFVYVADTGSRQILKIDRTGKTILTWNADTSQSSKLNPTTQPVSPGNGQTGVSTQAGEIKGVAVVGQNEIYVLTENCLDKFDANGQFQGGSCGELYQGSYRAITADTQGNIYLIQQRGQAACVLKYDRNGKPQSFDKGDPNDPYCLKVDQASAVTVDPVGNIFIFSETNPNAHVQEFDAGGRPVLKWGGQGRADGQFDTTAALASDGQGNLYVADTKNGRVQKFRTGGS